MSTSYGKPLAIIQPIAKSFNQISLAKLIYFFDPNQRLLEKVAHSNLL